MADFNDSMHNAAAKPTREAPLSAIESRLRRRRRLRQGAIGVCALAMVGALSGGIALSSDDGPSIRTGLPPAAAQVTGGDPPISLTLPDGWVESPVEPALPKTDNEVLMVGTALMPTGTPRDVCLAAPSSPDDVFIQLKEFTNVVLLQQALPEGARDPVTVLPSAPRPADFATATPTEGECVVPGADPGTGMQIQEFQFQDGGRWLDAIVGIGPGALPEQHAEAFAVLNSLEVTPMSVAPEPPATVVPSVTVPPVTVPPSADTEAIKVAFLSWINTRPVDASGAYIEDFESIRDAIIGAAEANGHPNDYTGRIEAITRVGENDADVIYSFIIDGQAVVPNLLGHAVKIDGVWKVSRDTVCEALLQGPVHCPPRK